MEAKEFPLPRQILGDTRRLKQVLINLVKNALKFTSRGKVTIFMGFDPSTEMLHTTVMDTGKGIKAEEMPKLFNLFGKLLRTADMNNEGIGMGLMIVKKLVHMSQGTLSVHSDGEDKGSAFTFTMQMKRVSSGRDRGFLSFEEESKLNVP